MEETLSPSSDEVPVAGAKWPGWVFTVVLLLIVGVIAFYGLRSTERIGTPDLVGMTQSEAVAELSELGLVAEVEPAENPGDAPPDTVVAQDPAPSVGLRPGTTVTLEVAPVAQ